MYVTIKVDQLDQPVMINKTTLLFNLDLSGNFMTILFPLILCPNCRYIITITWQEK